MTGFETPRRRRDAQGARLLKLYHAMTRRSMVADDIRDAIRTLEAWADSVEKTGDFDGATQALHVTEVLAQLARANAFVARAGVLPE